MSNTLEILTPMLRTVNGVLSLCVDGTALSEIQRCPKAAYYKLLRRRISAKEDRALTFGKVCAVAWDWRYRNYGNKPLPPEDQHLQDAVIEKAYAEMEPGWGDPVMEPLGHSADDPNPFLINDPLGASGVETNGKRSYLHAGRAKDVMRLYNQVYREEPFRVMATERSFETPLGAVSTLPVIWEGRYDMVVEMEDRVGDWVVDQKTTGKFGDDDGDTWKRWKVHSPCLGYCYHRWQETKSAPLGYHIRVAIVRPPLVRERKDSKPRNEFDEHSFPIDERRLIEWQRNTLATLQTFVRYAEDGYFPLHDQGGYNCSWCAYLKLCACEDEKTREMLLTKSVDFKANEWSPQTNVSVK